VPLRELLARFGLEFDDSQAKKADATIGGLTDKLKQLGQVLVGGALVAGMRSMVMRTVEMGDRIAKTADSLGFSVGELQRYEFAAKRGGVGADRFTRSLQRMNRNLAEARRGTGTAKDTLREAGIELNDVNGVSRRSQDIFLDVADSIAKLEDPAERARVAVNILGRSGIEMIPLLSKGRGELEKLFQDFEALGGGMSEEVARASEDAADAILGWDVAMEGLKSEIVGAVLPAITRFVKWVGKGIAQFRKFAKNTKIIEAALATLGVIAAAFAIKMLIAFAPFLIKAALIAAAFAAIAVVVEDLINMFTGGESVIADFIDELFGAGTAAKLVEDLKAAWAAFVDFIEDPVWPIAKAVFGFLVDIIGDAIDAVVGLFKDIFKLWDAISKGEDIGRAVFDFFAGAIQKVIDLVTGLIGKFLRLSKVGSKIAGFLGLGETQKEADSMKAKRGQMTEAAGDALFGPRTATATASGGGAGANVQQSNNISINVSATDPAAAARETQRRLQQSQDRTARSLEGALAQGA
jgi:hypothetical protein